MDIKRNDNNRKLTDTLTFGGEAQNLTGASVRFLMQSVKGAARRIVIADEAVIEDEALGTVSFELTAAQTAVAGDYIFEWEVTFGDGSVTTFPSTGWGLLTIVEDLG